MATRRFIAALLGAAALAVAAAPAGAATPLKTRYAPISAQVHTIGVNIQSEIGKAGSQSDAQLALAFAGLAKRTATTAVAVSQLKGANGSQLLIQQQLALSLTKGATDLARIAVAASKHDAKTAKAATIQLVKDSAPISAAHAALDRSLGLSA